MHVDQHVFAEQRPQSRPLHLARLKGGVAIREDDGRAKRLRAPNGIDSTRIEAIGKAVIGKPSGHPQHAGIVHRLQAIELQRPEIIDIALCDAQLLEDRPIAVARSLPVLVRHVRPQIGLHPIVVDQRVVDIEQNDEIAHGGRVPSGYAFFST